jgi:hypothetical protein
MVDAPGNAFQRDGALDIKRCCRLSATMGRRTEGDEYRNGDARKTAN